MRVLMFGDRNWTDERLIRRWVEALYMSYPDAIVVSGHARGADIISEREATAVGLEVESYPAKWDQFGRAAGPIRNREMYVQSTLKGQQDGHTLKYGICFHADLVKSKGSRHMAQMLLDHGVVVYNVKSRSITRQLSIGDVK